MVMRTSTVLFASVVVLSGCSTYAAARYTISADTVSTLRTFRPQTVNVGAFTASEPGRTEITCRAVGPVQTPDGEPFEAFVRKAFIDELLISEVYSTSAPVTLTGHLEHLNFSSTEGVWTIVLALASSNGAKLSVREEYSYGAHFVGEVACRQTAHSLMPAVQNVVRKAVQDPEFSALLRLP